MPRPSVRDVRDGLTEEAIESFRRTDRVQLGLIRGKEAAILGLWTPAPAEQPFAALVIRSRLVDSYGDPPSRQPLDMIGPARGGPWERIAAALRPADVLTLASRPRDHERGYLQLWSEDGEGLRIDYRITIRTVSWRTASRSA